MVQISRVHRTSVPCDHGYAAAPLTLLVTQHLTRIHPSIPDTRVALLGLHHI